MSTFNALLSAINGPLYEVILVPLLTFTGIYFTIRTKAVQITMLPESLRVLTEIAGSGLGGAILADEILEPPLAVRSGYFARSRRKLR